MSDKFLFDVATAISERLIDGGLGVYWREGMAPLASGKFALTMQKLPRSPDRVIALSPTPVNESLSFDDDDDETVVSLQLRIRGDQSTGTARDAADRAFSLLHGKSFIPTKSGIIILVTQSNSTAMGEDPETGRFGWVANYRLLVNRGA